MSVEIVDNPDQRRYEALIDGQVAGFAQYDKLHEYVAFPHTEVNRLYRGRGIAAALVQRAADDLRANGGKALPLCSFVKDWFDKNPEYADVLYQN